MIDVDWTNAGLWLTVVASGLYHGLNPGMGWPLALSAGLMGRGSRDLAMSLMPLAAGHLLAMLVILLPFALASALAGSQREIRLAGAGAVVAFGLFRLIHRRHPRALARIKPTQIALWSFVIALVHGAGLMLLPFYLSLCPAHGFDAGHQAASALMTQNVLVALLVSAVHALAMTTAGGLVALLVYVWLGMRFLSSSWLNLDLLWASSLILIGGAGLMLA
ncbi:MAG TPA: hypothetical protein VE650_05930 [Acetobacteraceae bacterium]|nr:hypothetical protein [Acetobacteraceae bacterium]